MYLKPHSPIRTACCGLLYCLLVAGCSSRSNNGPTTKPAAVPSTAQAEKSTPPPSAAPQEILVSVAASTKELMEALAQEFSQHHSVVVKINPGPSNSLANQILAGAPADLLLSANPQSAGKVQEAGRAISTHRLLTNRLVLVVPKGNPAQVRVPEDLLATAVHKCSLAGENVPAGIYADQALRKLGLHDKLIQGGKIARGQDVRSALSFVERGEAEAGIVYATDVSVTPAVEVVHQFDPALHDEIVYVLVLIKGEPSKPEAQLFLDFVLSPAADATLAKFHFDRLSSQ